MHVRDGGGSGRFPATFSQKLSVAQWVEISTTNVRDELNQPVRLWLWPWLACWGSHARWPSGTVREPTTRASAKQHLSAAASGDER